MKNLGSNQSSPAVAKRQRRHSELGGRKLRKAVLVVALLVALTSLASADVFLEDPGAVLWKGSSPTGSFGVVGSTGVQMVDIAFTPDGTLWGVAQNNNFNDLYTINPQTGVSAFVNTMGLGSVNALTSDPSGQLYAADGPDIYMISNIGVETLFAYGPYQSSGDLEYINGNLYLTSKPGDQLYKIPISSPNSPVLVGSIGFSDVYGLAYVNGVLYGYTGSGQIISIDITDGTGTLVGTGPGTWGATSSPAPEPGSLLLLGSGILGVGGFVRRRMLG